MNPLEIYVRGWHDSAASTLAVVGDLTDDAWARPTDCPGWSVQDIVAHLAHLEHELATAEPSGLDPNGTTLSVNYTQSGVDARRAATPHELIDELAAAVTTRLAALEPLPEDPAAYPQTTPGGVQWTWETLLRNRCIDMWVHEQDIRRAIGRPGGLDSIGAQVTTLSFASAMGYILGKLVRPPAGTSVRWRVSGEMPFDNTIVVGADGRAKSAEGFPGRPDAELSMSTEVFNILAAGRRNPDQVEVAVAGNAELAASVLAAMTVTF